MGDLGPPRISPAGSTPVDAATALDLALPDRDWSVLPEGVRRRAFAAPSGDLAMVEAGEEHGTRVVLIPGVTGSKEDFSLMLPLLAAEGFHGESFDLAGQYESAAAGPENLSPPRPRYDHDLFVGDLVAILESSSTPAHVLGYSFGGTVAQIALSRRPELFRSLTLMSTPPRPGLGFRGIKNLGPLSRVTSARMEAALMVWGIEKNLFHASPGRVRFVTERFESTRRSSIHDVIDLMRHAPDLDSVLAASAIPKLVAVGERDLWPLPLHREFARAIGAAISVYPTGHNPCETAPHQLVRDLVRLYAAPDAD